MKFQEEASISGLMEKLMTDNGIRIKCMGMEHQFGRMARDMKDISVMIRGMDKVLSNGKMEGFMMELGKMENNMVEESLLLRKEQKGLENGKMEEK